MGKTVRVNMTVETVRRWLSAFREELEEEAEVMEADTRRIGAPLTAAFYRAMRRRTLSGEVAQAIGNTITLLSLLPDCITLGTTAELADEELSGTDEDGETAAQSEE